jgi:hypothetical protein
VNILRIGFFVYEYPPAIVGGLGTYADYVTREYVDIGRAHLLFLSIGYPIFDANVMFYFVCVYVDK